MAVLFVSHSSKDDAAAVALETWLREHGFTDLFIDYSNIAGGEKWAQALREASGACRVIICLVTQHWLASDECFGEFKAAWYMGKRIIPLLALQPSDVPASDRLAKVLAEDQGFDVAACKSAEGHLDLARAPQIERRLEAGLRAAGALAEIGLDPEAFTLDRKLRPMPFPGLASFGDDDVDAALFYGRSREIAEALEELRQVHAVGDLRPFVILGASGAGKSSLLKAGIIPRLRREAPGWLPLRAFRPGADPLLNLAEALAHTLADFGKIEAHGVIRDRLFDVWSNAERKSAKLTQSGHAALEAAIEAEGRKLRDAADRSAACILISIDQAEEMVRVDGDSGDALADYLHAALAASSRSWQLAFTIRTDSFPELQRHRRFQDLKARGYDLRAVPTYRFESVVKEPAKRYGVKVDTALVDAVIGDASTESALPLLAFALQRLWHQYAASGALTKSNYDNLGGLKGLIEDAAERALRGLAPGEDVPMPSGPAPKRRVDLAASTFVPALAQINDQGVTIRRIAMWYSFSDEQQELLVKFDQWRLVVRKGDADGSSVEVVHEALFREWTRLQGWLEPERARLEALRSLQVDALAWDRNGRNSAFLNHRHKRLAEIVALVGIEAYCRRLSALEFDYIAACQKDERVVQKRTRRAQAVVGFLVAAMIVGLATWWNQDRLREPIYALMKVHALTAAQERGLKPKDTFKECTDCPEMVIVPSGSFLMGSPNNVSLEYERPQHSVSISNPFAVSKFEITFDEWDACAAHGDCEHNISASVFGRGRQPVINVTWEDAQRYVAWLTRLTGKPYRLLSEAEYEYVARAGTQTAFPWGDIVGQGNANCAGCGSGPWERKQTAPVGSFPPNRFALYDMAGNVWEWVEDCEHGNYDGAPQDGSSWIKGGNCSNRILRGGSWVNSPEFLRSAHRTGSPTELRTQISGFRVGRTLSP